MYRKHDSDHDPQNRDAELLRSHIYFPAFQSQHAQVLPRSATGEFVREFRARLGRVKWRAGWELLLTQARTIASGRGPTAGRHTVQWCSGLEPNMLQEPELGSRSKSVHHRRRVTETRRLSWQVWLISFSSI